MKMEPSNLAIGIAVLTTGMVWSSCGLRTKTGAQIKDTTPAYETSFAGEAQEPPPNDAHLQKITCHSGLVYRRVDPAKFFDASNPTALANMRPFLCPTQLPKSPNYLNRGVEVEFNNSDSQPNFALSCHGIQSGGASLEMLREGRACGGASLEDLGEEITKKIVISEECGIWGEFYQKKMITDMSCPGSDPEPEIMARFDQDHWIPSARGEMLNEYMVNCSNSRGHAIQMTNSDIWRCVGGPRPASCLVDDTSLAKVRTVGNNGSTWKSCPVYKSGDELSNYLNGRRDRLTAVLEYSTDVETLYDISLGKKLELACLIASFDPANPPTHAEALKARYAASFQEPYTLPASCASAHRLAAEPICTASDSVSCQMIAEFNGIEKVLVRENSNINSEMDNIRDLQFPAEQKTELTKIIELFKTFGR